MLATCSAVNIVFIALKQLGICIYLADQGLHEDLLLAVSIIGKAPCMSHKAINILKYCTFCRRSFLCLLGWANREMSTLLYIYKACCASNRQTAGHTFLS